MTRLALALVLFCGGCSIYFDDPAPDADVAADAEDLADAGTPDACVTHVGAPVCCSDYPDGGAPEGCI